MESIRGNSMFAVINIIAENRFHIEITVDLCICSGSDTVRRNTVFGCYKRVTQRDCATLFVSKNTCITFISDKQSIGDFHISAVVVNGTSYPFRGICRKGTVCYRNFGVITSVSDKEGSAVSGIFCGVLIECTVVNDKLTIIGKSDICCTAVTESTVAFKGCILYGDGGGVLYLQSSAVMHGCIVVKVASGNGYGYIISGNCSAGRRVS